MSRDMTVQTPFHRFCLTWSLAQIMKRYLPPPSIQAYWFKTMSRPPFPITEKSRRLRLVKSDGPTAMAGLPVRPPTVDAQVIRRGLAYTPEVIGSLPETGVVGDLQFSTTGSTIVAAENASHLFLWDGEALMGRRPVNNEFQLLTSSLAGPEIVPGADGTEWLTVVANFNVRYITDEHSARLGEIRLVDSMRFLTLEDSTVHTVVDTGGESVLYLEDRDDSVAIRQQTPWQQRGERSHHCFDYRISQLLPDTAKGRRVSSVTVLEQFTSYFMERPLTASPGHSVWVPVCAPVTWGWSMRAETSESGWQIARRKLMPPTVGHDGWELPEWRTNTLEHSCSM